MQESFDSSPQNTSEDDQSHGSLTPSSEYDRELELWSEEENELDSKTASLEGASLPSRGTKRKYEYKSRSKKVAEHSQLQKKRKKSAAHLAKDPDDWSKQSETCCIRECFHHIHVNFLNKQRSCVLVMNQKSRREYLLCMLDRRLGVYLFDGKQVCTRFLEVAFGFSRYLQSRIVKQGYNSNCISTFSSRVSRADSRDRVISYLNRLSERTADKMPDTGEFHLPFLQKRQVYERFLEEFSAMYRCRPPSKSYYIATWKKNLPHVKVRKLHRFTVCHESETMRSALQNCCN